MNNSNIRGADRKEEYPPHSRIFVVCSKNLRREDLRSRFEKFGQIEDINVPRDRSTGESKGFAYIKFAKTSSAAAAIQEVHMKVIDDDSKPTKVMLAINKNGGPTQNENEDKYRRLFIKVNKDMTDNEIRQDFAKFGQVESVHLLRDKSTDVCKGFAYVLYSTFRDAAIAFEECDGKYKAMFATPRTDLKRNRNSLDHETQLTPWNYSERYPPQIEYPQTPVPNFSPISTSDYKSIVVSCNTVIPQQCIEKLFNVVPGMLHCQYSFDSYDSLHKTIVMYDDAKHAAYAVDKLNNFEFPSGEVLSVKPDKNPLAKAANDLTNMVNSFKNAVDSGTPDLLQLADAIAQASTLIKAATTNQVVKNDQHDYNYCSVSLPPRQEFASVYSKVAQRLFIICKPQPPPMLALQDVFCRFGDLIDVSTFPNKTFGFVKYASVRAAQEARSTLHGATLCGIRLKVLEADEKRSKDEDKQTDNSDYDLDNKRIKLD